MVKRQNTSDQPADLNRLSILIVCQHFWPETFRINEMAFSLAERGHTVDVLCGIPNYPRGKFYPGYHYLHPRREMINGVRVYRVGEIPQWKKLGNLAITLNYFYYPFAAVFNLPRLIRKPYNIIFLYSLTPVFMSFPGILMAKIKRIPSIMYILDYWPDSLFSIIPLRSSLIRSIFAKISRWHYRHCDRILTPSRGMMQKVANEVHVPAERLSFLPQSCERFYENKIYDQNLHDRFNDRFNIIFAGNIGPAQSLEILIPTAKELLDRNLNQKWRFILIGDGMSRQALQASVHENGLDAFIVFEGHKPAGEIPKYHELADALFVSLAVNPLFDMMIPAKIQSYMAAGKPILAVLTGEGSDTVAESQSGFVCEPGDFHGLADHIVQLIDMPSQELKNMGDAGFHYYKNHYRHDIIMDQFENEIRICMDKHSSNRAIY